jgi:restriction system protein
MTVWMVRAGTVGEREDTALEQGIACIGWDEIPDLSTHRSREAIEKLLRRAHPSASESRTKNHARQLYAFAHRIKDGDLMVLPLKRTPSLAIGEARGGYTYRTDLGPGAFHTRPVKWRKTIPRTAFGRDLLYSLGAFLTVCQIERNNAEPRIRAILDGKSDRAPEEPESDAGGEGRAETDIEDVARDQIRTQIVQQFKGHEMARLVEAVLQAEGYETLRSPPGPDGGVDILASRGPLGLDGPRLCVQVKSAETAEDVATFRGLQGSMASFKAEQGLLVCWGGLTPPARREARQNHFSVRVWDSGDLLDAILRNYTKLPEAIRSEIPLKRIWTLVLEE